MAGIILVRKKRRYGMQTLIIGNGFDIDHNLPTKYKDFLSFIEEMNFINILDGPVW